MRCKQPESHFCRFPAYLANAAEVYANLEAAVRAAQEADRAAMFDASNEHMGRLDLATHRQLEAFAAALGLDLARLSGLAQAPA